MTLVSAHRAADAGLEALGAVASSGVDHVELDVRRTRDGVFVILHDGVVQHRERQLAVGDLDAADLAHLVDLTGRPLLTLAQCLEVVRGRAGAHIDLKLRSPRALRARWGDDLERTWEVQVVRTVLEALREDGEDGDDRGDGEGREDAAVITSGSGASVALLRAWAQRTGRPGLRVGLSLGRGVHGLTPAQAARVLRSELFPSPRLAECGANLVVAQKELALLTLARWGRRHDVPVLVWTVDTDRQLAHWLAPGRAWMVTTNRPARALQIAARWRGDPAPGPARARG